MLKKERQNYILQQVNLHNRVLSASLSVAINVSDDTIRRDLQELSEEGKLIKVHGGALSHSFNQLHVFDNSGHLPAETRSIAQKAVTLITDGMFVLTGDGVIIEEMARLLPRGLKATFISGNIAAIIEYMDHPGIEVILIGDRVSKKSKMTVGSDAISKIRQIKTDICFLGTNGIDVQNGITDDDWEVAQLKKNMIGSSRKLVCMAGEENLGNSKPVQLCGLEKIHTLITELNPDDPMLKPYADAGIELL